MRILASLMICIFLAGCAHQQTSSSARPDIVAKQKKITTNRVRSEPVRYSRTTDEAVKCSGETFRCRASLRHHRAYHYRSRPPQRLREVFQERMPPAPAIKGVVPVYFATNRKVVNDGDLSVEKITYARSPSSTYGRVEVSIPGVHEIGQTETPKANWFGFREKQDAGKHFVIQTISALTREQLVSAMATPADSLMLFVHGYNVSFQDAAFKAAQIAFDARYKGRVMMFSWPSMAGYLDYDYDRESALVSSDALFDLLKMVKNEAKVSKVIVIAHSLGSEVLIGALQQASLSGAKLGISELIFAASDVSADLYLQRAEQIRGAADKVTLYASSQDWALLASLKKSRSTTRMGYVLKTGPTLVDGVETIDVSAVGADMFALNHSTFSSSRAVLDDIGRILMKGEHPPHDRTPTLRLMPDENHPKYWMYPK